MGNVKTGWKVLKNGRSPIVGWHRGSTPDGPGVNYKLGVWAVPHKNCGPLSVFPSLQGAQDFRQMNCPGDGIGIMPCIYLDSNETRVWSSTGRSYDLAALPLGTQLAAAVMIVG